MTNQLILLFCLSVLSWLVWDEVSASGEHHLKNWVTKVFYSGGDV